jgi:hypothetical protein
MAYKTTIPDTTRPCVLFLSKEERYSCRAIAKKVKNLNRQSLLPEKKRSAQARFENIQENW